MRRQRGFSLIELMISVAIGLVLLSGMAYLMMQTSSSRTELERTSRQVENGRYAIERLSEDLHHASYYGSFYALPAPPAALADADPCATTLAGTPSLNSGLPLGVQTYDGTAAPPIACISSDDYQPNTDVLVIRRASTSTVTVTSTLVTNQPYIQATPVAYRLNLGTAVTTTNEANFNLTLPTANSTVNTTPAPLHRYLVRVYFVAKCNVPASGASCNGVSDDGGVSIPTLKMLELGAGAGGAELRTLAIAEGIEHLQVDHAIDDTGDGVADRVVMCSAATPCSTTDFSNVVAAHLHVVARNTERTLGHVDTKTYNLGLKGYTAATSDDYRRHAYMTSVRLTNVGMRRE